MGTRKESGSGTEEDGILRSAVSCWPAFARCVGGSGVAGVAFGQGRWVIRIAERLDLDLGRNPSLFDKVHFCVRRKEQELTDDWKKQSAWRIGVQWKRR